jgi:hypothetical protein
MKLKEEDIGSGKLYRCIKEIGALNRTVGENDFQRKQLIEVGEVVEFRFWSPANFRTIDEQYMTLSKEDFIEHFEYFAEIFNEVRNANKCSTKQIIDCQLYNLPK